MMITGNKISYLFEFCEMVKRLPFLDVIEYDSHGNPHLNRWRIDSEEINSYFLDGEKLPLLLYHSTEHQVTYHIQHKPENIKRILMTEISPYNLFCGGIHCVSVRINPRNIYFWKQEFKKFE